MLGLGIDTIDEDEDEKLEVEGVPFIVASDFILRYGDEYSVAFNADGQMVVEALAATSD